MESKSADPGGSGEPDGLGTPPGVIQPLLQGKTNLEHSRDRCSPNEDVWREKQSLGITFLTDDSRK